MARSPFNAQVVIDRVGELVDRVATLTRSEVLVGIPAEKAPRRDEGRAINNAGLAYVHEHGSPANNIPARPFLFPGVKAARKDIVAEMRKGAQNALTGQGNVDRTLHRVGMLARNAVVNAITDPEPAFEPLKPATVRARLRRTQAGRRQLRKLNAQAAQSGATRASTLAQWAGAGNAKPLIDSGQLRAAIAYVVRSR